MRPRAWWLDGESDRLDPAPGRATTAGGLYSAQAVDLSSLTQARPIFACNDWLKDGNVGSTVTPTRSGLMVDGASAYLPYGANDLMPSSPGIPPIT